MSEPQSSWAFVGISPEARQAAEAAAEAAGMELDTWLAQLIKYKSTMELTGREAVPLDTAIMQIAAPSSLAAVKAEVEEDDPEPTPEPEAPLEVSVPDAAPVEPEPEAPEDRSGAEAQTAAEQVGRESDNEALAAEESRVGEDDTGANPADHAAVTATPANEDTPEIPETVVLPGAVSTVPIETATKVPPHAPGNPRPRADNDTGPIEEEDVDAPSEPAAAAMPEPDEAPEPSPRKILPTEALRPSRLSALNQASEEAIQGAFDAWRDSRTLEPLLVRPSPDERNVFEVIVGIERWHAARRAHIRELPVLVHHASDEDAIRLAMSARLKRGPLSPLTEAGIYLSLMSEASMSTEQVARMVGKPPAHVATMVRVLSLPRSVRAMLERGEITALHSRALLDAPNAEALAREVIARRLDIYQTEQLVRTASLKAAQAEKVDLDAVDLDLSDGEYKDVPVDPATLDGETGFGPETRLSSESLGAAERQPEADSSDEDLPAVDDSDSNLVFDDVAEDSLELIDAPEIESEAVAHSGPPVFPSAGEMESAKPAEPKTGAPENPGQAPVAKEPQEEPASATGKKAELPPPTAQKKGVVTTELLEHHLSHLLGLKVAISEWHNMGVISIHYTNREELSDVVSRLNSGSPR